MTSTDDILSQIHDAVTDWEIGPDAMRSRPANVATIDITLDLDPFVRALSRVAESLRALDMPGWALHTDAFDLLAKRQDRRERRAVQVATRKYRARRKR